MADLSNTTRIGNTLALYDPTLDCVCIGGAALNLQLEQAGLSYPDTPDVDALCSPSYYDELLATGPTRFGARLLVKSFVRELPEGVRTHTQIDILPPDDSALKFTAAATSDPTRTLGYDTILREERYVTLRSGIKCMRAEDILVSMARVGRKKDIGKLAVVLPGALDAGLIGGQAAKEVAFRAQTSPFQVQPTTQPSRV